MGLKERNKGAAGEREVCALLRQMVPDHDFDRNLTQTREGGGDVVCGPLLIEVKRCERLKMSDWQLQAVASAQSAGMLPAIVWRRSKEKWWCAMPFEQTVALMRAAGVFKET